MVEQGTPPAELLNDGLAHAALLCDNLDRLPSFGQGLQPLTLVALRAIRRASVAADAESADTCERSRR